ncbi:Squamous cell carcinoma antigen recognized by T-cells 3 [Galdieria sulphuraria]|nr:Squamous cell carcinoma antigen recognized by T-cells 3 [Galdieria sulphuraria]
MTGNFVDQGSDNLETLETYQDWLDILEQLRNENDLNALNQAYENFALVYFLPPEIWLQWVNDERHRLMEHDRELANTRGLEIVERALNETLYSVELWLLYLDLSVQLCEQSKLSENVVRERFEQAVTQVALDFRDGWKVFEKYWEFEDKYGNKDNVDKLKMRCASLPFSRYPEVLLETKDEDILQRMGRNQTKREERNKYENLIFSLDISKATEQVIEMEKMVEAWKSYAEFETSVDLLRAKMIYERGLRNCYFVPDLWLFYLGFLTDHFPLSDLNTQATTKKAFSCVPNSVEIAKYAMRAQERSDNGFHELSNIFWKAWSVMSMFPEHLVQLSLSYLHCLRRLCTDERLDKKYFSEILSDFQKTFDHDALASADPSCQILRFIAGCFEVVLRGSVENIRNVWEQMLRKHGKLANTWLRYIHWEIHQQNYENARRLFRRGIHTVVEEVEILAQEWIGFEGLYGDNSQYEKALKVTSERKTFCEGISTQPSRNSNAKPSFSQKEDYRSKPKRMKTKKDDSEHQNNMLSLNSLQSTSIGDRKWHKDLHTIFVSNLPKTTTEEDFQSLFQSVDGFLEARLVKDREGIPKGFGYVEFQNNIGVREALKADQSMFLGQKIIVKRSKPPRFQMSSTPSRRIGIRVGTRSDKTKVLQETEEEVDDVEESSSQTTTKASWTQDDFRKWIRESSFQ